MVYWRRGAVDLPILILIAVVVVAALAAGWYLSARRRKELDAWAASKGIGFSPGHDRGMEAVFPHFDCLRQGSNRYAYNIMHGAWKNREFTGFDYHYETYSYSSKGGRQTHHHHFSAVVLVGPVRLKPLFIRPEGFFDKVTEFFGADDIDFESAEFSRKFFVKSPDRRWAFDVIHQRTMEFMLGMPQFSLQFNGPAVIAWRGSRFGVADFEQAAELVEGILERLPEYVLKQLAGPAP